LFDQSAAIQWIRDNISAFGGNPNKITLMGQSAGAMSVDIHLTNPLVKDYISGAVLLSGSGLQRMLLKPLMPEKTAGFWNTVMKNAGVNTVNQLKTVEPKTLYYAWLNACRASAFSMPYTLPVYDGKILHKGSFSLNTISDVPYILGSTCTDMMPIVLQRLNKKWGKHAAANHKNKCYIYNFTRRLPGDDKGAWHSADLLYAFSTLDFNWRLFEKIDYKISNQLSQAICAFAKNGNPNCAVVPEWTADYKNPMHFCENTKCAPWDTFSNFKSTLTNKGMG